MTQNGPPNDVAVGLTTSSPSTPLYGGLFLVLAGFLAWHSWARGKFLIIHIQDKHSLPSTPVQTQPETSSATSKHIWIRIGGVPVGWSPGDIWDALRTVDMDFDVETQLHKVSMFPACIGDSLVALCELDSRAGIIRRISSPDITFPCIPYKGGAVLLSIDTHFYDLTPLNAPEAPIIADVVAVTGLAGHAFGSWRSRSTGQMWLKDFLPEDVRNIRVMTYGYNSNLIGDAVDYGFLEYRQHLIQILLNARQNCESRPIIFIGHSIGGILILQALLQCKHGGQYRELFDATRSIYFFATPHQGVEVDEILLMLEEESMDISTSRRGEFLQQLQQSSNFIKTQREDIMGLWGKTSDIEILSFYETRKTPTIAKSNSGRWERTGHGITMVPKGSAQLFWHFEHRIPVSANHTDIVKFPHHQWPTYDTLVRYMKDRIKSIVTNAQITGPERQAPIHFMVPYSRNKSFIGQEESRNALDCALGPEEGHRRLGVWGLGGIGKTETVLDYVYKFHRQKSVFWIHGGSRVKFELGYRKVAQLALLPRHDDSEIDIRPQVREWLESEESGNWILVLDNADNLNDFFGKSTAENDEDDALAKFMPYGSKGTILVTTRDEEVAWSLCENKVLPKEAMSRDDAISLFKSHCPRITSKDSDAGPLDALLKELLYLPLAIVQAASYLRRNRLVTLTKYLEHFQNKRERVRILSKPFTNLRHNPDPSTGYQETVLAAFTISFQQIEEQSTLASSLLRVMACINRQGMPVKLFESVKRSDDADTVNEALDRMIAFSLLTLREDSTVEMHAFIHISAREYLSEQYKLEEAVKATATIMADILPEGDIHGQRLVWREYLPHAAALVDMLEELEELDSDNPSVEGHTPNGPQVVFGISLVQKNAMMVSENFDFIYYQLGSYYLYSGQYSSAKRANYRTCQISTALYGKDHPGTLTSMANLALTYSNQGWWSKAEELEVWVMETRKKVLGEDHPDTLTSMANLASTYRNQGRWKEAEKLEVQVMETSLSVPGAEEHPDTLTSMANLASTYRNQGRWKEAEKLEVRVMDSRKKVLGEEHPDTLSSMANLAVTYRNQGRWKEAEELEVLVMETRKRVLDEEHPDTLNSIANLASTYWSQGRWKEAEELEMQVLETRKRILGEEHPDTLTSMDNLASTYRNQGQWKKAEELEAQVMETSLKALGEEHPDTLSSMANLAAIYSNQGQWKKAEELEVRVMDTRKRVLGEEHPNTLTSMANLAVTYSNQGQWKEAEVLEGAVMETRKRLLGEEHPDTLTSMANFAATYRKQGGLKRAEELEVQVMETCSKVLGEEHPDTLNSMSNLALTYMDQGRWKEAKVLEMQVLETRKRVLGEEHPDTLISMDNLAAAYRNQGRWKEAEELEIQVMETSLRVLGEEHPDTLINMANLASTYRNQGRLKEAEGLEVRVMVTRKRILGEEHPDTLTSMANLAATYRKQKRWKRAEKLEVQAMDMRKKALGEEHPDTLSSMATLAAIYLDQGRWKRAEKLEVQVMGTRKRVLGEEHPGTLSSMASLASIYWNQGRLNEAEGLEMQVMETRKRVLGEEHPDTLTSMANLAHTLADQERLTDAIALMERAVELLLLILGEHHPDTISSMEQLDIWKSQYGS